MVQIYILGGNESMDDVPRVNILQPHKELHHPTQQQFLAKNFLFAFLLLDVV